MSEKPSHNPLGQPAYHQPDYGYIDQRLRGIGQKLMIAPHPAVACDPREGSLDHSPSWQHDEPSRVGWRFLCRRHPNPPARRLDDLQSPSEPLFHPLADLAVVASVGPHLLHPLGSFSTAFPSKSLAPSRSAIFPSCTTTALTNPVLSTNKCRFLPLIFLPSSNPRMPPCSVGFLASFWPLSEPRFGTHSDFPNGFST